MERINERKIWACVIVAILVIFAIVATNINDEKNTYKREYLRNEMALSCMWPTDYNDDLLYADKDCMNKWR